MSQSFSSRSGETGSQVEAQKPLWHLVALQDFTPPANAAPEVVRSGLHDLWRRLRGDGPHTDEDKAKVEMERPSQTLLDWAAPAPDWAAEEMAGVESDLHVWLESDNTDAGVQTIVDAPIPLLRDRLVCWATKQSFRIVQPPTPEQILSGDRDWLNRLALGSGGRLLLPSLERCFLRHHNGLDLLRRLLDHIDQLQPPLLVVCNSWAWRYFCQVVQIEGVLGRPFTSAAFDDGALNRWLSNSAHSASPRPLIFREASSGQTVLNSAVLEPAEKPDSSAFLKSLAARSRGNPRIAWDIWQRSLLATKDSTVEKEAQEAATEDEGYTLWVRPWDQVQLPDLAGGTTSLDGMVLYTLLQHGGLAQNLVSDLLPDAPGQVLYSLHHLREGGFVQRVDNEWHPTPIGYPAIRRFLAQEGFLVDDL